MLSREATWQSVCDSFQYTNTVNYQLALWSLAHHLAYRVGINQAVLIQQYCLQTGPVHADTGSFEFFKPVLRPLEQSNTNL